MANTKTITKALQAEGLPLELVRDEAGYHYFIYDDEQRDAQGGLLINVYETHSVMCPRFGDLTPEQWLEEGRSFAQRVREDRAEAYEAAAAAPKTMGEIAAVTGFDIPEHRVPELVEALTKLAKKARRYGAEEIGWELSEPFVREEVRERWDGSKQKVKRTYINVKVTGPAPRVGEYRFLARIEHTPAGNLVDTIPGETLPDIRYRETRPECDHCRTSRDRKETFLVQHEDGRLAQVGRSCLRDYMGTDTPSKVAWRFQWERLARETLGDEERLGYGRTMHSTEEVVALTIAAIRIWGWCSKGQAENSGDLTPTIFYVQEVLNEATDKYGPTKDRKRLEAEVKPEDWEAAREVLAWAAAGGAGSSDYGHNLKLLASMPEIEPKRAGFIASAVAAKAREDEKELRRTRERQEAAKSEWVGEVKERLRDIPVTFESSRTCGGGFYGPSYLMKFRDGAGNVLTWFSSNCFDLQPGEQIKLDGTVKAHTEYNGAKETQLTRCAIK